MKTIQISSEQKELVRQLEGPSVPGVWALKEGEETLILGSTSDLIKRHSNLRSTLRAGNMSNPAVQARYTSALEHANGDREKAEARFSFVALEVLDAPLKTIREREQAWREQLKPTLEAQRSRSQGTGPWEVVD